LPHVFASKRRTHPAVLAMFGVVPFAKLLGCFCGVAAIQFFALRAANLRFQRLLLQN
jgi:hypothetical protein